MIFFNFWVGPGNDQKKLNSEFHHFLGKFVPMIPSRGESIEFDTLIIFPLVLKFKNFQNLGKSMSKSGLQGGGSPCLPLTLIRLAGLIGITEAGFACRSCSLPVHRLRGISKGVWCRMRLPCGTGFLAGCMLFGWPETDMPFFRFESALEADFGPENGPKIDQKLLRNAVSIKVLFSCRFLIDF